MALTFERLSAQSDLMTSVQDAREPTLLCDCWGVVRAANASALSFVAVQFGIHEARALGLRLREPGGERPELAQAQPHQRLFMGRVEMLIFSPENPDTPLEPNGAVRWDDWTPIGTMDLLLTPLPSGAFWVRFGPHVRSRPGSVSLQVLAQRFLRQMVALNRSVELLRNEEEVVELFATTLTDLLGDVGLVVQLQAEIDSGMMVNFIRPFGGELHIEPDPVRWLSPAEEDTLPEDALMLAGAVRGCRFRLDATGRSLGVLQVESCDDALKLTFEEREMILLFAQHLSMALSRHQASPPTASRDAQSPSSVSGSYMLLNAIDALVIICDTQRRIRAVNRAFRRVVGRGRDRATDGAFIGQDLLALVAHEDAHTLRHAAAQVMGSKASQTIRLKLRVGEEPYTMHLSHLGTPGGVTGFSAVCYRNAPNFAEDRLGSSKPSRAAEAQHRLGESQRLIALGRLAIGLAHELKSPMTTILSYADYLLSKYRDSL
ncbi:MAG: PAS domain-containing protein, partial [Myxococcota bacterium]